MTKKKKKKNVQQTVNKQFALNIGLSAHAHALVSSPFRTAHTHADADANFAAVRVLLGNRLGEGERGRERPGKTERKGERERDRLAEDIRERVPGAISTTRTSRCPYSRIHIGASE